ncbi:integrase, catalytic region, zinc finger, CCHC-type containing protein [Tanacetum coccineum]
MREKSKEENVNYDYCEIETKNVELENSMAKLLSKNECLCKEINHVKQVFKDQFDSIKRTRVCTKEQSDSLIDKLNLKSTKNDNLKAQIQDKVFVITSLKNDLQKLKGKEIVDIAAQTPSAYTIVPIMFKIDLEPLAPVKQAKTKQPLDKELDFAYQSLQAIKKNDRISRTPSRNMKNKLEAQPRKVNKKNSVAERIRDVNVNHSLLKATSEPICVTCKKSMFDGVHDMCLLDFVENVKIPSFRFDDHIARIIMYGDYQLGNVTISRVYYIEGLRHNLFSVGQFYDADLEVAFQNNTCFIHNLEGVDLLSGFRDVNLYTISLDDMLKTSLICLLSKASKTKSWLWHRWLSHLNFGTLRQLAKGRSLHEASPQLKF